jgi:hypothetical protein
LKRERSNCIFILLHSFSPVNTFSIYSHNFFSGIEAFFSPYFPTPILLPSGPIFFRCIQARLSGSLQGETTMFTNNTGLTAITGNLPRSLRTGSTQLTNATMKTLRKDGEKIIGEYMLDMLEDNLKAQRASMAMHSITRLSVEAATLSRIAPGAEKRLEFIVDNATADIAMRLMRR